MSEVSGWLSLRVLNETGSRSQHRKASLRISIPKKIIPLATQRNRIKRLIREVLRHEIRVDPEKVIVLKVLKKPGGIGLEECRQAVRCLWGYPGHQGECERAGE